MNAVYAYNPETLRFTMEFEGNDYQFLYSSCTLTRSWNADGKLIATTYKGFRDRIGIIPGSKRAQDLMDTLGNAAKS